MYSKMIWIVFIFYYIRPLDTYSRDIISISDVEDAHHLLRNRNDISPRYQYRAPLNSCNHLTSRRQNGIYVYDSSDNSLATGQKDVWPLRPQAFSHPIQSPVDLVTHRALTMDLPRLSVVEPHPRAVATLYNSGHTAYVYIKDDPKYRPKLTGGPLRDMFIFEQMHFHWGSEDIWGSEHFVDGESYAAEIHLVHYNSKYKDFEEAAKNPDGLSVVAGFAEAHGGNNQLLEPLSRLLRNVSLPQASTRLDGRSAMQWALSAFRDNVEYYAYPGSLTTDPYSENVSWIVLPRPIRLSCDQLHAFRRLHQDNSGAFILDNKRGLQPLFNRPIVRGTRLGWGPETLILST